MQHSSVGIPDTGARHVNWAFQHDRDRTQFGLSGARSALRKQVICPRRLSHLTAQSDLCSSRRSSAAPRVCPGRPYIKNHEPRPSGRGHTTGGVRPPGTGTQHCTGTGALHRDGDTPLEGRQRGWGHITGRGLKTTPVAACILHAKRLRLPRPPYKTIRNPDRQRGVTAPGEREDAGTGTHHQKYPQSRYSRNASYNRHCGDAPPAGDTAPRTEHQGLGHSTKLTPKGRGHTTGS